MVMAAILVMAAIMVMVMTMGSFSQAWLQVASHGPSSPWRRVDRLQLQGACRDGYGQRCGGIRCKGGSRASPGTAGDTQGRVWGRAGRGHADEG